MLLFFFEFERQGQSRTLEIVGFTDRQIAIRVENDSLSARPQRRHGMTTCMWQRLPFANQSSTDVVMSHTEEI